MRVHDKIHKDTFDGFLRLTEKCGVYHRGAKILNKADRLGASKSERILCALFLLNDCFKKAFCGLINHVVKGFFSDVEKSWYSHG